MRSVEPSTGSETPVPTGLTPAPTGQRRRHDRASTAIDLQERERRRIGFDLHDGPAQTMSAALLQVRMLEDTEGDVLREGLDELRSTLKVALDEIYELIENLGGRDADADDLVTRIQTCIRGFSDRYDMAADLDVEGTCAVISRSLEIATFRIIQEALSNAGRHSGGDRVHVGLWLSSAELRCEIADDGVGFSVDDARSSRHGREAYGLTSMAERARLLDGDCTVESAPGEGTRVRVRIPVWHR